jgi:type II secretory pathway component PulM
LKDWFAQLSQRDQLSLLVLGLALGLYLLYSFAWQPLGNKRTLLEQQNSAVATSLQKVDAMVSEILRLRDSGAGAGTRRNLTSLINQSTSRRGLQVTRLQPNSRGEIQVRLEGAAFDEVLDWLHEMENQQGLLVMEAAITPAGMAGRVNATVRIAQA